MSTTSDVSRPEFLEPVLPIPPSRPRSIARRVIAPLCLLAIVAVLFTLWFALHRHLMAMMSISMRDGHVQWELSDGKWMRGGESTVSYDVYSWKATEDAIRPMVDLNHVISLDLTNVGRIPLRSYALLKRLPDLRVLSLSRTSFNSDPQSFFLTDDELPYISGHHELVELYLDGNRITDKGLAKLTELPKLEIIDLSRTDVTDAGLMYLRTLPNLKTVHLDGPRITDAGITAFAIERPEVEITRPDPQAIVDPYRY